MPHEIRPLRDKTIDEIEGVSVAPPFKSGMIERISEVRRVRLRDLSAEDLRLLVSQGIALSYVYPIALQELDARPLLSGQVFVGDLLCAAIYAEERYGATTEHRDQLRDITKRAIAQLQAIGPTDWNSAEPFDPGAPDEIDRESLEPKLVLALERLERSNPAV